jgi:hypothetical protein
MDRNRTGIICLVAAALSLSNISRANITSGVGSTLEPLDSMMQWCVDKMVQWNPPGRPTYPLANEEIEDTMRRYADIARDAISVIYDESETPLFPDIRGRARTLAVLLSIAHSESGFRRDVDFGLGRSARGDMGASWCLMQVQLGAPIGDTTPKRIELTNKSYLFVTDHGYSGQDLIQDRKLCFRVALRMIRSSIATCKDLPIEERLSNYTSGNCISGKEASRIRMLDAMWWFDHARPPVNDLDILTSLAGNI